MKFTTKYRHLRESRCNAAETSSGDAGVHGNIRGTGDAHVSSAHHRRDCQQLAPDAIDPTNETPRGMEEVCCQVESRDRSRR